MPQYVVRAVNLPSDPFIRGYPECAEWAGIDDSGAWCEKCEEFRDDQVECPGCGEWLYSDRENFEESLAPKWSEETLKRVTAECEDFKSANASDLEGEDMGRAGHDFYLTRNRHGAGFWDGDYEKEKGERLTEAAHAYGETHESFNYETETLESN